jgi:hypothetical protein
MTYNGQVLSVGKAVEAPNPLLNSPFIHSAFQSPLPTGRPLQVLNLLNPFVNSKMASEPLCEYQPIMETNIIRLIALQPSEDASTSITNKPCDCRN